MKNLTLLAALAACGVGVANAQTYVTDQPGIANTNGDTYYAFQLDDVTVQNLQDAGKTVFDYRIDNASRNLYIWENTMVAGDGSYPGVDMQTNGYIALEVGSAGWSGAGLCIGVDGDNTPDSRAPCRACRQCTGINLLRDFGWRHLGNFRRISLAKRLYV